MHCHKLSPLLDNQSAQHLTINMDFNMGLSAVSNVKSNVISIYLPFTHMLIIPNPHEIISAVEHNNNNNLTGVSLHTLKINELQNVIHTVNK